METLSLDQLVALTVMTLGAAAAPYMFLRLFSPFDPVKDNPALMGAMSFAFALPFVPDQIVAMQNGAPIVGQKVLFEDFVHLLIGGALALALSMPFKILTSIGQLIDNQRGLSINGPQNPIVKDPTTTLENLLAMVISIVFFYDDFHIDALDLFFRSVHFMDGKSLNDYLDSIGESWLAGLGIYRSVLMRLLPLIGLLLTIDIVNAIAVRRLQSGDLGSIQTVLKNLVTWLWVIFLLKLLLDVQQIEAFRTELVELGRAVFKLP
jgi:flagellar biosynthesis protein FliR